MCVILISISKVHLCYLITEYRADMENNLWPSVIIISREKSQSSAFKDWVHAEITWISRGLYLHRNRQSSSSAKGWYPAVMQRAPNRFNSLEERRSILGSVSVSVSNNFKLGFDTRSEFPIHLLEGHWTGLWVQWGNLLETHLVVPSLMQEKSLQTETGCKANKARSQYSWQWGGYGDNEEEEP